eukprot:355842-Chlamydomonas_euryale.AAC.3
MVLHHDSMAAEVLTEDFSRIASMLTLNHLAMSDYLGDMFTQPLGRIKFLERTDKLGLSSASVY